MQPEWRQDSKTKDIYPHNMPQFELAGAQLDSEVKQQASKLVFMRFMSVLAPIFLLALGYRLIHQSMANSSVVGTLQKSDVDPFRNKLRMRLLSSKRTELIEGTFFDSTPQAGFSFLVVEIEIRNTAEESYQISPYSFSIETSDGASYITDLVTKRIKNRLGNKKLGSGSSISGKLVFRIPKSLSVRYLNLRGMSGPIATISI